MTKMEKSPEAEFMLKMVEKAFWGMSYHESGLVEAHRETANAVAIIKRCGFNFTIEDALEFYAEGNEEMGPDCTPEEWLKYRVGSTASYIDHHERGIKEAHESLALATVLISRGAISGIDFEIIRQEQEQRRKAQLS